MTSTDLHEFLRSRRSIRRFKTDAVPDSVIHHILTTATFAPSAHNRQPWRFVVVTTFVAKCRLADSMGADFRRDLENDKIRESEISRLINRSHDRITSAPLIVILSADASEMDTYPDTKRKKAEYMMAVQSVANAGMQMLLAIHAEGLGAVWTCGPLFTPETVQNALDLPKAWEPQAMFFVGYPAENSQARERKPLETVLIRK